MRARVYYNRLEQHIAVIVWTWWTGVVCRVVESRVSSLCECARVCCVCAVCEL